MRSALLIFIIYYFIFSIIFTYTVLLDAYVILEVHLFNAYYPLSDDKSEMKKLRKLTMSKSIVYLEKTVKYHGVIETDYVRRVERCYKKSINRIKGTAKKVVIASVSTIAVTAATFGVASIMAPQIAIGMYGSNFAGLYGMALQNACLAFAGGGSLAIGGTGVAGGTLVIAGGGALLGLACGGTSASIITFAILKNPKIVVEQAAKLEVVMKEIILNSH